MISLLLAFSCTVMFFCCPLCLLGLFNFLHLVFLSSDSSRSTQSLLPIEISSGYAVSSLEDAEVQHLSHLHDLLELFLPQAPSPALDTQHSLSVIQASRFPLQSKTSSNSSVLRLFIAPAETEAVLCSFQPFQQSFSLPSLSQLLSEPQLPLLCGVQVKAGCWHIWSSLPASESAP